MTAVCLEDVKNGKKSTSLITIALEMIPNMNFLLYWTIDGIVLIGQKGMAFHFNFFSIPDFDVLTINRRFTTKKLLQLDLNPKGMIHVSILAQDSAQIIFTQDESFRSGYMIVLGGWTTSTSSKILS